MPFSILLTEIGCVVLKQTKNDHKYYKYLIQISKFQIYICNLNFQVQIIVLKVTVSDDDSAAVKNIPIIQKKVVLSLVIIQTFH